MSPHWAPAPAADLPDGLILFDGVCVLCDGWVRFVIRRDEAQRFRFLPIQDPAGRALAARFGIHPDMPQSNAIVIGDTAYFKWESAVRVLETLPGWRWIRVTMVLPRGLRNWLYDRIARNRYWLFGRYDHCVVPDPAQAHRFAPPPLPPR
jgi:predicted DCC family thiol-disulfide oxidoreductase YuxK